MSNINELSINGVRAIEGTQEKVRDVLDLLQKKVNLSDYPESVRQLNVSLSQAQRICLFVGLCDKSKRSLEEIESIPTSAINAPFWNSFFSKSNIRTLLEPLIKLRYHDVEADWTSENIVSKVIGLEMLRGRDILLQEGTLDEWLTCQPLNRRFLQQTIPALDLCIGEYENKMPAKLDLNSTNIANTQVLIVGTTGSGKTNLMAVLLEQIRKISVDSNYPVNFLLFDYKGEFSDPSNSQWLEQFETDTGAILDPMTQPLPFTPFKDFSGRPINEVNLYATTLATALGSIASVRLSANMDNRLSEAIIQAYKQKSMKPISFKDILKAYKDILPDKKKDDTDSVISILAQLERNNIFADEDRIDLMKDCYIINLGRFNKDGVMAKAIVYFVLSKLNNIYEQLPKQEVAGDRVELRHFTIIDEAHYMLGFENRPLQNLIAVGRNKGMSIILATQNMESFKSKHFDFYANAQYPLMMRQQQQNDGVLKDLFGVSGHELNNLKKAISGLEKGELITKDAMSKELGIGKCWKKISVTHLI